MQIGAVMAGASEEDCERVREMALAVGLAFQIQDDILDVTSSQEVLGKPVLSDEKNHKTTYVSSFHTGSSGLRKTGPEARRRKSLHQRN